MKKFILALAAAATLPAHALTTGDVAFTGFNADRDLWSLVTFVDIAANTNIYFSDNEWTGSTGAAVDTNEHTMLWNTGTSIISKGTVVLFTEVDAATDIISASVGTLSLASGGGSNLGLNQDADTFFAYLGSSANNVTTFLTAVTNEPATSFISAAGLTVGVNAVALTNSADYADYTGARSGLATFPAYASLVNNSANWSITVGGNNASRTQDTTAFSVVTATVPEPESYALLLAGFATLCATGIRRSKA